MKRRERAASLNQRPIERHIIRNRCRDNNRKRAVFKNLHVDGHVIEDRAVWTGKLQRHCDEVYDNEETAEKQQERIMKCETDSDKHFTKYSRRAEMTFDSVIKEFLQEKKGKRNYEMLPRRLHAWVRKELPTLGVKLVFLRTPDAEPRKGIRSCGDVEVVHEGWKQLHLGGVDGLDASNSNC